MNRHLYFISALLIFFSCQENTIDYDSAINNCRTKHFESVQTKEITAAILLASHSCIIGSQLPDFEATSLAGKKYNKENLYGNMNIINFWFITCPPCVKEMPELNSLVEKYSKRNINFIAIGRDSQKDIEEFLTVKEFKFDIVPNGSDLIYKNFNAFWGYPTTMVTDTKGKIIAMFNFINEKKLTEEVEPLILKHSSVK